MPALLVLLADLRGLAAVDRDLDRYTLVGGASIYPFGWSILLAAHDAGLGGVMTTMLVREESAALSRCWAPPMDGPSPAPWYSATPRATGRPGCAGAWSRRSRQWTASTGSPVHPLRARYTATAEPEPPVRLPTVPCPIRFIT